LNADRKTIIVELETGKMKLCNFLHLPDKPAGDESDPCQLVWQVNEVGQLVPAEIENSRFLVA
jgi:hypothetical protein